MPWIKNVVVKCTILYITFYRRWRNEKASKQEKRFVQLRKMNLLLKDLWRSIGMNEWSFKKHVIHRLPYRCLKISAQQKKNLFYLQSTIILSIKNIVEFMRNIANYRGQRMWLSDVETFFSILSRIAKRKYLGPIKAFFVGFRKNKSRLARSNDRCIYNLFLSSDSIELSAGDEARWGVPRWCRKKFPL